MLSLIAMAPASSWAGGAEAALDARAVAQRAADVHDRYCGDVASGRATAAAEAMAAASPVLAELSRAYDVAPTPSLRYWRGMLNAGLLQDALAQTDLEEFLSAVEGDPLYAAPAQQARRRLLRLGRGGAAGAASKAASAPTVVLGGVLLGAGGVLGAFSGQQDAVRAEAQARYDEGLKPWNEAQGTLESGQAAADRSRGLLAGGLAAGTAGVVALVVSAVRGAGGTAKVGVAVFPVRGGLALTVGGAW